MHFESLDQLLDTADPRSATARPQTRSARARQLPDSLWTALFCFFLEFCEPGCEQAPTDSFEQAMDAATEKAEAEAAATATAAKAEAEAEAAAAAKLKVDEAEAAAIAAAQFKAEEDARAFCDSSVHPTGLRCPGLQ